ncbi:hypothetical protein [Burkholderia pseudomallei]|uniref:hypothetical protein n=1 Tax=Burkholderia pseudomallei TaxID=28450 RepID=UPI0003D7FC80|nr:hypothetical protein [Burkholderia pseudomallei]AHE33022.1 hypothetical protein BBS_1137 [Burkholderia pseudomallei NAU20B-16]AHG33345.1 hypothetical protein BBQ_3071 [Burkholderia pseudomallei MSHR511]AHG67889.1 hypothetical protein BBN_3194 [Burkholderia pseudomallei MSHR146]AIS89258.1 hypothetical protein BBU_1787 [Burkholderia pseudomallei NAU35A-3]KGC49739.1 hypothetical protein DO65_2092 [Burkholderia pseudomallei]
MWKSRKFSNWTIDRAKNILRRKEARRKAEQVKFESIEQASQRLRRHRDEVANLEISLNRVRAKGEEFYTATERVGELMALKRDELIASAREGREPNYQSIDEELERLRNVLGQYADEQVNVPAAIARIEAMAATEREEAEATHRAAQNHVYGQYLKEYEVARRAYIDLLNSPELVGKLEWMMAMGRLYCAYLDDDPLRKADGPRTEFRRQVNDYLDGLQNAGGDGKLNDARIDAIVREHIDRLFELGIGPVDGNDSCPTPSEIHVAEVVAAEYEEALTEALIHRNRC